MSRGPGRRKWPLVSSAVGRQARNTGGVHRTANISEEDGLWVGRSNILKGRWVYTPRFEIGGKGTVGTIKTSAAITTTDHALSRRLKQILVLFSLVWRD